MCHSGTPGWDIVCTIMKNRPLSVRPTRGAKTLCCEVVFFWGKKSEGREAITVISLMLQSSCRNLTDFRIIPLSLEIREDLSYAPICN